MPKLVVLDQSLRDVGGHHFDYAFHTLQAARKFGFEIALACHRTFRDARLFPDGCRVLPIFRHHTYSRYSDFVGIQSVLDGERARRNRLARLLDDFKSRRRQHRREKRIASFARGCALLHRQLRLEPGDHVLATTMSELDLLGLSRFLHNRPAAESIDWHLQFHFNIFDGREPEYDEQSGRLARIRRHFAEALRDVSSHRLHFYNTSETLTRQYNRLGVARFDSLAYPTNPAFHEANLEPATHPLRVTCPGIIREEKGQSRLAAVMADLGDQREFGREVRFVVQARFRGGKPETPIELPADGSHGISYVEHPLSADRYADLVRRAAIGLLMYDSRKYYARRAGVLGEFLAAGIPVIVPAGCWLAEQVSEPIYRYQRELGDRLEKVAEGGMSMASWTGHGKSHGDAAKPLSRFGPAERMVSCALRVPHGAARLLIEVDCRRPGRRGLYFQVEAAQEDADGRDIERVAAIVGHGDQASIPILIPIADRAHVLRCRWTNPYHDTPIELDDIRFRFLKGDEPLGAVGLVAANPSQVGRLLRDMIRHYDHYRDTAREFAGRWRRNHDPRTTVQQLIERANGDPRS